MAPRPARGLWRRTVAAARLHGYPPASTRRGTRRSALHGGGRVTHQRGPTAGAPAATPGGFEDHDHPPPARADQRSALRHSQGGRPPCPLRRCRRRVPRRHSGAGRCPAGARLLRRDAARLGVGDRRRGPCPRSDLAGPVARRGGATPGQARGEARPAGRRAGGSAGRELVRVVLALVVARGRVAATTAPGPLHRRSWPRPGEGRHAHARYVDGRRGRRAGKYDEPGALFAEKRREDWLRDAHRLEVVRWVPQEMRTPAGRAEVADRFRRAFARHRRTG